MIEIFTRDRRRLAVLENALDVSEDQRANALWYLSFSLPENDPKNSHCQPFHLARSDTGQLYRIMPCALESGETGLTAYQCEHVLATLLDKVLFGAYTVGNLGVYTGDVIRWILSRQPEKNWQLGRCEFNRQFEYAWEQENLLAALFSVAAPFSEEYLWTFDTSKYPWTVNLLRLDGAARPELFIRTRKNLLRRVKESDPQQICTRLYPLGYGEGVNQLGVAQVNRGIPYVQSPPEYIQRYGIIERVWIDRRYEDSNSLLAAAKAMLAELQDPAVSHTIEYMPVSGDPEPLLGMLVQVDCEDTGERFHAFLTGVKRVLGDTDSIALTLSNHVKDIASTVADLADRQRIESAYAQGATQIYSQALQTNSSPQSGAVMDFFIPSEMRIINKVLCKIRMGPFRSYSKATQQAETEVLSSTSVRTQECTSSSGGGGWYTGEAGGGELATTSREARTVLTSQATILSAESIMPTEASRYQAAKHDHGVSAYAKLAIYGGKDANGNLKSGGYVEWVPSGAHSHGAHSHSITIDAHRHTVDMPDHTHDIYIDSHQHDVVIPGHSHTVTVPAHAHDITPGIFFSGNPRGFGLYVNGVRRALVSDCDAELDITSYLLDEGKKIPRGSWLSLEIRPDDLAYISVDLIIQGFVQSRGDYTV